MRTRNRELRSEQSGLPAVIYVVIGCGSVVAFFVLLLALNMRPSRELPPPIVEKLKGIPTIRANQHLVDLTLDSGRIVSDVYVGYGKYPAMTPRRLFRPYDHHAVVDVRPSSRRGGTQSGGDGRLPC